MAHDRGPFFRSERGDDGGDDRPRRWSRRPPQDDDGRIDLSDPVARDRHNRRALLGAGLGIAIAFLIASIMPQPLVMAAFREILFFGSMGVGLISAFRREPILAAPVFTGWDRAAIMMLVAQISGAFIDHEAVEAYLQQVQDTGRF
ncbi:hypothetical protein [Caenispirillum bisanense]|uniref:hypothetical protein n=1 Tax=Caenispirillum bisanense TaxID=414052 RepID=UPI0031E0C330